MRWEDERYVRVYTRDTTEWIGLSWQARAVFHELLRKVDRAGLMQVGKSGTKGLAGLLRMPHDVVASALEELIEDTCVVAVEDGYLIRNFIEAQEARASDKARKQSQRERARDLAGMGARARDEVSDPDRGHGHSVTNCDSESRDDESRDRMSPRGHTESQPVTPSLAVPSQTEPAGAEEPEAAPAPRPPVGPLSNVERELLNALRGSQCLAGLATVDYAKRLAFWVTDIQGAPGKPLADAVQSIREADEKVANEEAVGEPSDRKRLAGMVMGFVKAEPKARPVEARRGAPPRPRGTYDVQSNPGELAEIERRQKAFQAMAEEAQRRGDVSDI